MNRSTQLYVPGDRGRFRKIPPWMFHLMKVHDAQIENIAYETDREKFIGRGNSIHEPQVMTKPVPLQDSSGSVLDPIVSIQYSIVIEPT